MGPKAPSAPAAEGAFSVPGQNARKRIFGPAGTQKPGELFRPRCTSPEKLKLGYKEINFIAETDDVLDILRKINGKSRAKTIAFKGPFCYNKTISVE